MVAILRILGLMVVVVVVVGGCNPSIHVSGDQTANASLRNYTVDELTRTFNRQVEAAKDIQMSATLWDLAYIVRFQEARTTRKEQSAEVAKANIAAWRKRFVEGQTSFRIRVELLNRGEVLRGQDRILELKQWSWKLRFSDGKTVAYSRIHVELAKRYKAPKDGDGDVELAKRYKAPKDGDGDGGGGGAGSGGYHHRLDGVVHFARRIDPAKHRFIELLAYPPGDRPVAKLRWNLKRP